MPPDRAKPKRRHGRVARLLLACVALAAWLVAALFAVGQFSTGWPEALISPWPLVFAAALACLTALLMLGRRRLNALLPGAVAIWAVFVWMPPLFLGGAARTETGHRLRVVEINVRAGTAPAPEVLAWIHDASADIVVVIECTQAWKEALDGVLQGLPHRVSEPHENPNGIALYSRLPVAPESGVATSPAEGFAHIDAVLSLPAATPASTPQTLRVLAVHTLPPVSSGHTQRRNAELAWLAETVSAAPQVASPATHTIAVGDFNETPWGKPFAAFMRESGLRNASQGMGVHGTWHSSLPALLRIPIDHCLVSSAVDCIGVQNGPEYASDHVPIMCDLVLVPQR